MTMRRLAFVIALCALPFAALADQHSLPIAGMLPDASNAVLPTARTNLGAAASANPVFSGSFSGTYALGGTPSVNGSGTYDLSTVGSPTRYNQWAITLSPSVDTTNIWE